MPTFSGRKIGALGAAAVALATLTALAAPATAAKDPGAWDKPGVPLDGQQHPDPSAVPFGQLVVSSATQHGGADLPVIWTSNLQTWIARNILPNYANLDGDKAGYFNDAINNPAWGPYKSCTETASNRSGCDPKELWAPGFAFVKDHWVSYSAVKVSNSARYSSYGRFAIYRATSATPFGMYSSVSKNPIVSSDKTKDPAGVLDPEVFVDQSSSTKQPYLLYKTEGNKSGNYPTLWSRKLDSSGTKFASGSKPVKLLTVTRSRAWEGRVIENPSMTKVNGKYLLFYSANDYPTSRYTTAYAICKNGPSRPCSKPSDGRLLKSVKGSYGPGGADAFVDDRGRDLLIYHAFPGVSGTRGTGGRQPHVAEFTVSSTGAVKIVRRDVTPAGGAGGQTWYGGTGGASPSFTTALNDVSGTYTPFVASLNADDNDDVGLYGTWNADNAALLGNSTTNGLSTSSEDQLKQRGAFQPVSGDFNGDGRTDVYWYEPGGTSPFMDSRSSRFEPNARLEEVWISKADGTWDKSRQIAQDRVAIPIVGDFDGNGTDEIWWYQPGGGSDEKWTWSGGSFKRTSATIATTGTAAPVVGDLDGDGKDDVLWYQPGSSKASIWWSGSSTSPTSIAVGSTTQNGGRRPVIGDFDGNGKAEILWYGPRAVVDSLWSDVTRAGTYTSSTPSAQLAGSDVYQPLVGDFNDDGVDDIYWYG